jgi:trimethylamine--corrinoid protein Co-methyltransferase
MTALLPALAGANVLYGMGMLELGVTFSFGQLVIDNTISHMVKRAVKGVDVTDDTLAVDLIRKVGGGSGKQFLTERHTMNYMRTEQSRAGIFDRRMRETWEKETGGKDAAERANELAKQIINDHKPEPLDNDIKKELRRIVESAE